MPDELKYLSIVESALNPRAMSRVGAGGLWQFMPYTGKDFNLNIDDYVDDRMDPNKATEAACRYLKDLYRTFGEWEMALAAYNCGPGAVRRAMRRTGGTTFWTCYEGLPKETRSYVPQFIAITYLMNWGNDHGIVADRPDYPIAFDTLQINTYLNLKTFASLSGISFAALQKLNPSITADQLPDYTRNHMLRVPSERYGHVQTYRKAIMDSATKMPVRMENVLLANNENLLSQFDLTPDQADWHIASRIAENVDSPGSNVPALAERLKANRPDPANDPDDLETVVMRKSRKITHEVRRGETLSKYYRVQPGDTLWTISQRYGGISIDKLKKMNRIKGNNVRPGQKLLVG